MEDPGQIEKLGLPIYASILNFETQDFLSRKTPTGKLSKKGFKSRLLVVKNLAAVVTIDTPPIMAVTDAAIVGKHTGTTMRVVRFGRNPVKEIELCHRRFEQNGVDVKGVVFNAVEKKASAYGYGGYYSYEYKSEKA